MYSIRKQSRDIIVPLLVSVVVNAMTVITFFVSSAVTDTAAIESPASPPLLSNPIVPTTNGNKFIYKGKITYAFLFI